MENQLQKACLEKARNLQLSDIRALSVGVGLGVAHVKSYSQSQKNQKVPIITPDPQQQAFAPTRVRVRAVRSTFDIVIELLRKVLGWMFRCLKLVFIDVFVLVTLLTMAFASVLVVVTVQGGQQHVIKEWALESLQSMHPLYLSFGAIGIYCIYWGIFSFFLGAPISRWLTRSSMK